MQAEPKQQRSSSAHERNKVHDFIIEQDFEEANNRSLFATFRFLPQVLYFPLKKFASIVFKFPAASQAPLSLPLLRSSLAQPNELAKRARSCARLSSSSV